MPVTPETLRLAEELQADLDNLVDNQTRDLVRAWADAWDEVAPDLTAAIEELLEAAGENRITRRQMMRAARLRRALAVIAEHLQRLADQSAVRITSDLQTVVTAAATAQAAIMESQLPPGVVTPGELADWSRVDERQLEAIVRRTTEQITARHYYLEPEAYPAVRRELIRGVAAGSNPKATARRMVRRVESRFNGGLTRALVISRTETLDAHRAAAAVAHAEQADVLTGWTWIAKLDTRTCASCWAQHGSEHKLREPGPLDHHQGRCARLPKTKSWADLGFDIEEPDDLLPDAASTFEELRPAQQIQILGRARYAAWRAGRYPMEAWSQRRKTDGWRDAYHVSPAPKLGRRSTRAA
jgi:uncharacterized protein with gpF-like domain